MLGPIGAIELRNPSSQDWAMASRGIGHLGIASRSIEMH